MQGSLWHRCLRQLEGEVPEQQFNTWVRPLQAQDGDGVLRLFAPNRFVLDWVQQNLYSRIVDISARESGGGACQVIIEVGSRPQSEAPAPARSAQAAPARRAPPAIVGGRVNPDFTFDTFVEGKSNQLARAAAVQVAENPGKAYNPLFIYGGVGLG